MAEVTGAVGAEVSADVGQCGDKSMIGTAKRKAKDLSLEEL